MSTNKDDFWFKTLVRQFPRAEVIEDVLAQMILATKPRNADYFFENRRFVGELKSLTTSRMPYIQSIIDRLRDDGELPIFYHPAPITEVIRNHPNQKKLNRQFLMEIAKRLEKDFREANSQIRETKALFNTPQAKGFILLTNSDLREMTIDLAWNELHRLITRKRGQAYAYEHINFAIYLQDVEVVEATKDYAHHPLLTVLRKEDDEISAFTDQLLRAIAQAKGFDFLKSEEDPVNIFKSTIPHRRFNPPKIQLTRSDVWKKSYLDNRKYRQLTDQELLRELGRFMMEEYLVVKDGKIGPDLTPQKRDWVGETIEGLFTECELRFLDMRDLSKEISFLFDQGLIKGKVADLIKRKKPSG